MATQLAGASAEEVLRLEHATRDGLSSHEAEARLERVGPNELQASGRTFWAVLLAQLRSPLLALLAAAAAVSIGVGEGIDGAIILTIIALSVGLGVFNEYRSERQILLNNLLYDVSELTIPTDNVDEELLRRPEHWDIGFITATSLLPRGSALDDHDGETSMLGAMLTDRAEHQSRFDQRLCGMTLESEALEVETRAVGDLGDEAIE